uniref:Uncharacterized protein n=1 Tax=Arundo donax TaxID=35708 RepID=A0A0A9BUS1_ARUDO
MSSFLAINKASFSLYFSASSFAFSFALTSAFTIESASLIVVCASSNLAIRVEASKDFWSARIFASEISSSSASFSLFHEISDAAEASSFSCIFISNSFNLAS